MTPKIKYDNDTKIKSAMTPKIMYDNDTKIKYDNGIKDYVRRLIIWNRNLKSESVSSATTGMTSASAAS